MKNKIGIIYGLIDPRYDIIRYIGQIVETLEHRFVKHMTRLDGKSHKVNWIKKLISLNLKPKPVLLVYDINVPFITYLQVGDKFVPFYDYDALDKEERLFISITREECAAFGIDCVNGTDGGDGFRGGHHSKETRDEISDSLTGKKLSEEHKKSVSIGMKNSEKFHEVMQSEEYRNKFIGSNNPASKKYFRLTLENWT